MARSLNRTAPLLVTLLAPLLLGGLLSASAHAQSPNQPPPHQREAKLSVQSQASIEVAPDKATLSARLWERTPTVAMGDDNQTDPQALREARDRLEERTAELIRTLEAAGLERDAISAGSLNVRPDHIPGQRGENGQDEYRVRTQLERPITLSVDDLERLPTILDALTEAGVNALDGVQYDLHDRDAATDEALVKAIEKAQRKGELLADAMQVELGRVLLIQETQSPIFIPRMAAMRADAVESLSSAVEYRPGMISLDAGVTVEWAIESFTS
ncbi:MULTISPECIES: SIMPL domain-containing protein [Halomonadaceae]|uniref:SIMPL domain-containing protein n=1 Tax=Halomonadaceae TaxID=28256 RepID=UPI001599E197|nr:MULTISPECIES: SIMPL domain-containing protein [Halomonas]QJQ95396.1 SIMPL domain-containing protein [Halomonas sp. PA5]